MTGGTAYDTNAGILVTALRISSTIIPEVLAGKEFWVLCLLNLTVCISRRLEIFNPEAYNVNLPWGLTSATGSLMTFFVCFYNRHVFERYNLLYDITKQMAECCLELVSNLRVNVPEPEVQRKVSKYLLTSCFLFFFERTGEQSHEDDGKLGGWGVSKHEYDQLRQFRLLDEAEISLLKRFTKQYKQFAMPSFAVLQWIMLLLRHVTPDPEDRDDFLVGFDDRLYVLRSCMADVANIMDLPMPFQYFHIMNMMLVLNLVLWAYALGCQDSLFAPLIYMFVQMMFQGIRELSTALSNPFGDDEVDFPINDWMAQLYSRMFALLEDDFTIDQLQVPGDKPLKDPESTSRKINLLVDRDTATRIEARRRRVKAKGSGASSLALLRSFIVGPAQGERDDLMDALDTRRAIWQHHQRTYGAGRDHWVITA